MEIKSSRLVLRAFTPQDAEDLYAYLSDPEVVRYEPYGVFTREQCVEEAKNRAQNPDFWAVTLEGRVIGNLYFHQTMEDCYTIGWVFSRDYQHKGYATEAANVLLSWAFGMRGAWRVEARCDVRNPASRRVMERLHMRHEGTMLRNVWFKKDEAGNPIWKDTMVYAILGTEWAEGGRA